MSNQIHFGSVCSGIEAASVAWHPLGWKAAWLSEIEPFPSALLAHHYPDVPNLGDMTTLPARINAGEVMAPDVFCGGTPCQAFSVAGLRQSLDDARGNLSLTFCEIANAIDTVRLGAGQQPAIIFWENVPGVLNTKDNAFGCFLAGIAGEDKPLLPSGEKWTGAGCVLGSKRAVAWRVLDAQYFGLAQRRKRVFVVASAREGFDPAAVLFEFDGVRRDFAPSREARKEAARTTATCTGAGSANEMIPVVGSLCARTGISISVQDASQSHLIPAYALVGNTIGRKPENGGNGNGWTEELSYTLTKTDIHCVMQPIPIDMRNAGRDPEKHDEMNRQGVGVGEPGDPAHTVTSAFVHAVAQPIAFQQNTRDEVRYINGDGQIVGALAASAGMKQTNYIAQPIAFDTTQITSPYNYSNPQAGDPCHPLAAGAHPPTVVQGRNNGGENVLIQQMAVRRLTPTECERLQGFPDGYTAIPWRKKEAAECPDGPRYKALGNSWAVPVVRWIGQRIQEHLWSA